MTKTKKIKSNHQRDKKRCKGKEQEIEKIKTDSETLLPKY